MCRIRGPGALYLVRFAAPEFTSLCPVTGQPDFAHLVIDYAPGETIVESKSLKLFLSSFRNHAGFHEDVTVGIAERLAEEMKPLWLQDRRLLVSARRHSDRRLLAIGRAARRPVDSGSGRAALPRAGLTRNRRPRRRLDRLLCRRRLARRRARRLLPRPRAGEGRDRRARPRPQRHGRVERAVRAGPDCLRHPPDGASARRTSSRSASRAPARRRRRRRSAATPARAAR